ncbi:MAG: redoxin domain-containing protein [Prolixibacteraceae bacterium]|nr:redoxin domain-containing protein [Prolixibacteraceae bacterium]
MTSFDQSENSIPHIGDQAPAFRSVTAQSTIYFPADYFGKWVILFSYPSDSNPALTSEFNMFASMYDEFKALNCDLIGLPVDRPHGHIDESHSIREKIEYKVTKDVEIKFPLIEDTTSEVARKYGMIQPDKRNASAVRALFFIDPKCVIRAISYYPLSLGLNFYELKRVIGVLQTEDETIPPPVKLYGIAKERVETKKKGKQCYEWSFCTKELSEGNVVNVN